MGRREWEGGSIVLPRDQWVSFRKELLREWNEWQERRLQAAKEAHSLCKDAMKGVRGGDGPRYEAAHTEYMRWSRERRGEEIGSVYPHLFIYDREARTHSFSRTAPQKKNFRFHKLSAGPTLVYGDNITLRLDNDTRTVQYHSGENKSAVEDADKHPIGKALFSGLRGISWKRKTGGALVGNDEYNQDAEYEGGGGNYVTRRYGPLGKHDWE